MKISEVMSTSVISVSPTQTVAEAAKLMSDNNIGAVPVADNGKIRGVLTDRDIVLRCVAQNLSAQTTKTGDVMTTGPVFVTGDTDVNDAMMLMSNEQVRRLPVLQDGRLTGFVSLADIAGRHTGPELADAIADISMP